MKTYKLKNFDVDSVELKCLLISRGVKVDKRVYKWAKGQARLDINPLCCNCMILSCGTIVQLTDTQFHLQYLSGILSWDNIKLLRNVKDLATPFTLRMRNDKPVLFYEGDEVDEIRFPPISDFYRQHTSLGRPYDGNSVIQGLDWVAFQCLWPCEFAAGGESCQFCFSGGDFENLVKKGKNLPSAMPPQDLYEIISYAIKNDGINSLQITGGSTYNGESEAKHIAAYLNIIEDVYLEEVLLYITPPKDRAVADLYFELGASRIACSLEVWDIEKAKEITPGKINRTGRENYLQMLEYIAQKHGPAKAFSNMIIGIEEFDSLAEGASWLAERGILPTASIWMPMGRPVQGSMKPPELDYYRRTKEHFAELYVKYGLKPPVSRGLNVCIEQDIWKYSQN